MKNHFLRNGRVLLFGHRGYSSLAPENTLAAFRILLEKQIPGAELDVRRCKSGELVVTPDAPLERVTGLKGGGLQRRTFPGYALSMPAAGSRMSLKERRYLFSMKCSSFWARMYISI